MSTYVVTEIHWSDGEVGAVKWGRVDGVANDFEVQPHVADVDEVVRAFDCGDTVFMTFTIPGGTVLGPRLVRRVIAGGLETVREEVQVDGRTLRDLPTF